MTAPLPNILTRDIEVLMDAFAYMLSTDPRTSDIQWILGDVGMGEPSTVPFGYISLQNEALTWYSAAGGGSGGQGGLAAGQDDWTMPIVLSVAFEPHRFVAPIPAQIPDDSPFFPASNEGFTPPYLEQPGWRRALLINNTIKQVLRTLPGAVVLGAATDTRVVESRWLLLNVHNRQYRAARNTVITQQRRTRGL